MIEREPIFHDRQLVITPDTPLTITSTSFADIPGASLTTKDLGSAGVYFAWLSMSVSHSKNNSSITFRGMVNGEPTASRTISFGPNSSGDEQSISMIASGFNIPANAEIKVQWLTSEATATLLFQNMIIDGVPNNRVI